MSVEYSALNNLYYGDSFSNGEKNSHSLPIEKKDMSTQTDDFQISSLGTTADKAVQVDFPSAVLLKAPVKEQKISTSGQYIYKVQLIASIATSIITIVNSDLCMPLKIVSDFYSVGVSVYSLCNSNLQLLPINLFRLVKSIICLACTILIFPVRIGLLLLKDIIDVIDNSIHIIKLMRKSFKAAHVKQLLYNLLKIVRDILCMVGFAFGSLKLTLAYFIISLIVGAIKATRNFRRENYLKSLNNILGCMVSVKKADESGSHMFSNSFLSNKVNRVA